MCDEWIPPSVTCHDVQSLSSYSYATEIPPAITAHPGVECVLGVDEAGRGPVLGSMVYGVAYCPVTYTDAEISSHGFMDSKVLDHDTRFELLHRMCDESDDLCKSIGWTVRVMSAQDIGAGMLRPKAPYNLNAQAHDTTIQLIRDVLKQGVNVRKIFVDTVGLPEVYQAKLSREFPMAEVVVAKKADSLYPIVSVASICAKVTRDLALEASAKQVGVSVEVGETENDTQTDGLILDPTSPSSQATNDWGSGYPSDARTVTWLKANKNPIFGWHAQSGVRYSWSTVKDMLQPPGTSTSTRARRKQASSDDPVFVKWHDEIEEESGQSQLSFDRKNGFSVYTHYGKNVGVSGF